MRVIRKYANRRLYDTQQSRYVTLEDLRRLIIEEEPFRVEDAKSGEDLTRTILLSIIIEQEQADSEAEVFSNDLLAQLIRVYDMSSPLPLARYLEQGTQLMLEQQKRMHRPTDGLTTIPSQFSILSKSEKNHRKNNFLLKRSQIAYYTF